MNRIKSLRERKEYGRQLCDRINQMLGGQLFQKPEAIKTLREILEIKRRNMEHRSFQSYKYAIDKFEKWLLIHYSGSIVIDDITKAVAREFVDWLFSSGLGGYAINGIQGFLSALFNVYADRSDTINPFSGCRKAKLATGKNIAFSPRQRDELWSWMDADLLYFTKFSYFTFGRPKELLRLRVHDLRLDIGEVIIIGTKAKAKTQRTAVIPDSFINEVIEKGYDKIPKNWYVFGRGLKPGPFSYGRNQVTKRHTRILRALDYDKQYTLYSWRHTGACSAYLAGVDIYSIMRQLGHSSLDMTQIYLKSMGMVRNEQFGRLMV